MVLQYLSPADSRLDGTTTDGDHLTMALWAPPSLLPAAWAWGTALWGKEAPTG